MTTTKTTHRSLVSLDLPRPVPTLLTYAEQIVKAMTNNPSFVTPSPAISAISQAIADLQAAEAAALARTKGAVQGRNNKRDALVKLLQLLKAYVQSVADTNAETAATVIKSGGLAVKKAPTRKPRIFSATAGTVSGSVKVVTDSAGPRTAYEWQYSTDGGKTWIDLPGTIKAGTSISGLTAGTTVMFRYRTLSKVGQSDWVTPIAFSVK